MVKNRMKILAFFLTLVMIFSLLSACGPGGEGDKSEGDTDKSGDKTSGTSKEEEVYNFGGRHFIYADWDEPGPNEFSPERQARLEELQRKHDLTLEFIPVPFTEYNSTFTASVLGGEPIADIVQMHYMWFYPGMVSKGFFIPVDDLGVFDFTESKWDPFLLEYTNYKGRQYGIATGKTGAQGGIFWNKTLFERDGLPDLYELQDNYEWTWDKLREIAIAATRDTTGDGHLDQWGIDGGANDIIASNDAFIVDIIDGVPTFGLSDPKAIEALQYYQDMKLNDEIYFTAPGDASWDYGLGQFAEGKTAMICGAFWMSYMFRDTMSDDWGFVFFPMGPKATEYRSVYTGFNFPVIPSGLDKPEEIALLWDLFTAPFEDETEDSWISFYENQSPDRGTANTIIKMIENNLYTANIVESFPELTSLYGTMHGQISLGNMTAQAAVEMIINRAEDILKEAMSDD